MYQSESVAKNILMFSENSFWTMAKEGRRLGAVKET
jgi:hypothetical protein